MYVYACMDMCVHVCVCVCTYMSVYVCAGEVPISRQSKVFIVNNESRVSRTVPSVSKHRCVWDPSL